MRVLVLSDLWLPFPGGAERLMFNLARYLLRAGEEVKVLTGYEAPLIMDGPAVVSAPIGIRENHADGWYYVESMIVAFKPDVILTHHLYAYEFAKELERCGVPVVQVVLNGPRLDFAARAVYISRWVRRQAGNDRPGDMVMLPPAFEDVVAPTHERACGFIKPIKHKGVELIYQLAEVMPEEKFIVLRGEWQDLEIIRTDLPNVEFIEPVVHIQSFWRRCDIALVPSRSEDAGTVAQEASVNGLPCISSNVQGLLETNHGGIRLPPNALELWREAILELRSRPKLYAHIVNTQRADLEWAQAGKLAQFHGLIQELV